MLLLFFHAFNENRKTEKEIESLDGTQLISILSYFLVSLKWFDW